MLCTTITVLLNSCTGNRSKNSGAIMASIIAMFYIKIQVTGGTFIDKDFTRLTAYQYTNELLFNFVIPLCEITDLSISVVFCKCYTFQKCNITLQFISGYQISHFYYFIFSTIIVNIRRYISVCNGMLQA